MKITPTLPKLPFKRDALAPIITAETFDYHHGEHHATYVNNLTELVKDTPLSDVSVDEIIQNGFMSETCMNHIENYWKDQTTASNELFQNSDFGLALLGYKDALYRAEVLNNHVVECLRLNIPFVQIFIISCNNLANTYEELGQNEEAENMLKRVVYYLLHRSGNKGIDIHELHSELKRAAMAYVNYVEENSVGDTKRDQFFGTLKEQLIEKKLLVLSVGNNAARIKK